MNALNFEYSICVNSKKKKRNPGGIIILLQLSAAFEIIIQFGRREIHFSSRGCKKKKKKSHDQPRNTHEILAWIFHATPANPSSNFALRQKLAASCITTSSNQDVNSLSNFTFKFLSLVIRLNSRKELFQACIPSLRWNNPAWYSIDITLIICSRIFIFKQNFQIFQFEQ